MNHADERVAARLETMRRDLAGAISSDEKLNGELRVDLKAASHHKNPEGVMKRRRSRGFVRFLVAICYWCRRHLGLASLRRDNQTDNREKGSGAWLVTGSQAGDRELDRMAWLDELTQSRKHRSGRRAEGAHRSLPRPGAGAADGAEPRSVAGNGPAAHRRSRPDDA
jgi:hypothetical protein